MELRGAANATAIIGGSLKSCDDAVYIWPGTGQTYIANAALVLGTAFEGNANGVRVVQQTNALSGLRIIGCRFEALTDHVLKLSGTTAQPAVPTYLGGNYFTPDVANYISNPDSQYYVSDDSAINSPRGETWDLGGALTLRNRSGTGTTLDVQAATSTSALDIRNTSGTLIGKLRPGTDGTKMRLQAQVNGELEIIAVRGISAVATPAENLRGSVTFASSTTATVTFPNAEVDGNYYVALGPQANKTFWVSGKGTSGFTINASSSSSDTVEWIMVR